MKFFRKKEQPEGSKPGFRQWAETAAGALKGQQASKAVFQNGAMASALTALVLAAVILVNLAVGTLPAKYTQWDMSQNGIYSISDTTKELLDGLEQDITFYYLAQSGYESESVVTFLDRYTEESKHLNWEQKDPAVYPTFAQQYGAETASEGSIIVVCGERSKVIDSADLYTYDYSNYYTTGSYDVMFDGEQQLTSAVYYVTTEDLPRVYTLTGHGEQQLTGDQENALNMQNIELADLSLVSAESIPEDAAALLIAGPTVDYTADDVQLLRDYLNGGGKLIFLSDSSADTPNLNSLLAEYGLSALPGLVVEGDSSYHARGFNYYLLPEIESHESTSGLANLYVMLPYAQAIQTTEMENVTVDGLLSTSSSAYNKAAGYDMSTTEKEEGDQEGPFDLAVAATKTLDEDAGLESQVIWISSVALLDQNINASVGGGNDQFLLGCLTWLSGQDSSILIAAKSLSSDMLTVNAADAAFWGNLTTIVLPVICLIAGAAITIKRRRQ